ncbi:MAG: class I SAM-dependent methyltransferase [bacterium]|nr:class I SAM-dependent methyltransferase [bacterium]
MDVYVFDQLQKGNIAPGMRVLDAGCGGGRNLVYLLRAGYAVYAADTDAAAVGKVRTLAAELAPKLPPDHFRAEPVEELSFPMGCADVVICNAVLHFARDHEHFDAMLGRLWHVLAPGGMLFTRLASSIGIEDRVRPFANGRYGLPDGSERYLVDEERLLAAAKKLGAELVDPIKTTNVQGMRCMTTWVVRKGQ